MAMRDEGEAKNAMGMDRHSIVERYRSSRSDGSPSGVFDPKLVEPSLAQRALSVRLVVAVPDAIENEVIAILNSPSYPGETIEAAFTRKEQQLRNTFARLTPLEARALHQRLEACRQGDQLASLFGRLIAPRRARLLAFLSGARRREALAAARR